MSLEPNGIGIVWITSSSLMTEAILKIKVHGPDRGDLLAWHYEKSGIFTVHSAYQLVVHLRDRENNTCCNSSVNPSGNRSLWKSIWKLNVPQKIKSLSMASGEPWLGNEANQMETPLRKG